MLRTTLGIYQAQECDAGLIIVVPLLFLPHFYQSCLSPLSLHFSHVHVLPAAIIQHAGQLQRSSTNECDYIDCQL